MRSGAPRHHLGYFHEAAFYGSDEEVLEIVVPFLLGGLAAGEPTVVAFGRHNTDLVRAALPDAEGLIYPPAEERYLSPAATIRQYRQMFTEMVKAGAEQIRVVGNVPHPGLGVSWDSWGRYEAAVNHAFDDLPIWGLCPYDTRITPAAVLSEVSRTHPWLVPRDGVRMANADYEAPTAFLRNRPPVGPDPLEAGDPELELVDPSPAVARHAVEHLVTVRDLLDEEQQAGLCIAVSEVVTNAIVHGRPPVLLRVWTDDDRVLVTVHDAGGGLSPDLPFVGLLPPHGADPGGLGLWIAHQSCADVTMVRGVDGFTVRLSAGGPPPG